jgi:hypothetical protein
VGTEEREEVKQVEGSEGTEMVNERGIPESFDKRKY